MAIAYCCFTKVRLQKSKKTNISPTIARNIPTAVRIANQTRRIVPVRIATAFSKTDVTLLIARIMKTESYEKMITLQHLHDS